MLSNNEYCLRGGDRVYNSNTSTYISLSYESNKQILDDSFGSSNCTDYTNYYECSSGSLDAKVYSYGLVRADDGNGLCEVDSRGSSNCSNIPNEKTVLHLHLADASARDVGDGHPCHGGRFQQYSYRFS